MTRISPLLGVFTFALVACGGTPPATSATESSTTDDSSTGSSSSGVTPTTTESTGTTSSESTSESSGGESDSATGTTADIDPSTGTTVDPSTSTGETPDTSTSASTGETPDVVPGLFAECKARTCPESDPLCVSQDGPGGFDPNGSFQVTWSFCTRECETDDDCASGLEGGTAPVRCVQYGPNMVNICVLDCGFGQSCPDQLSCSNDAHCGTKNCSCSGNLCNDPLCAGP